MAQKRWTCPRCGAGALAPERPRRDDARRYCLPCTAKTGRLVQRTCPALEAKRVKRAEQQVARKRAEAERNAAVERQRFEVAGRDVREEWRRLCRLPLVKERLGWRRLPLLTVHRTNRGDARLTSGHCKTERGEVHVTLHRDCGWAEAGEVLCHELAHAIAPYADHGSLWRNTYVRLVREAYGVEVRAAGGATWELDGRVREALRGADAAVSAAG